MGDKQPNTKLKEESQVIYEVLNMRFPPFESGAYIPDKLPIFSRCKKLEVTSNLIGPQLDIGSRDGWFITREYHADSPTGELINPNSENIESTLPTNVPPLSKSRRGWSLHPHAAHLLARHVVKIAVVALAFSIIIPLTEALLMWFEIMDKPIVGGLRIGILDYPALLVLMIPLWIAPTLIKFYGNMIDVGRQRAIISNPPPSPTLTINSPKSNENLEGKIEWNTIPSDWTSLKVGWHVGFHSPKRDELLATTDADDFGRPPPPLTTVPSGRELIDIGDGTGEGEELPSIVHESLQRAFHKPLRMTQSGGVNQLPTKGGSFNLTPPSMQWPGTEDDGLIRVVWELVVTVKRERKLPLYYHHPLSVASAFEKCVIPNIPIREGRIEELVDPPK